MLDGKLTIFHRFYLSSATVHLYAGPVGRADVRHVSNRGQCGFAEHTLWSEKLSSARSRKDTRKQSLSFHFASVAPTAGAIGWGGGRADN